MGLPPPHRDGGDSFAVAGGRVVQRGSPGVACKSGRPCFVFERVASGAGAGLGWAEQGRVRREGAAQYQAGRPTPHVPGGTCGSRTGLGWAGLGWAGLGKAPGYDTAPASRVAIVWFHWGVPFGRLPYCRQPGCGGAGSQVVVWKAGMARQAGQGGLGVAGRKKRDLAHNASLSRAQQMAAMHCSGTALAPSVGGSGRAVAHNSWPGPAAPP